VDRFNQRQGFLLSATVHLILMTLLTSREMSPPREKPAPAAEPDKPRVARVLLPPPEVLRQVLRPPAQRPEARPAPAPTPPPEGKDRISIGPPSSERAKGPLVLRREDDLTQAPKGTPNAAPVPPPPATAEARPSPGSDSDQRTTPGSQGLRMPPGLGSIPRGEEASRPRAGETKSPSIASSLRNLDRRLQDAGPAGLPSGTGQQMGPLFFDPLGADFTVWINHFKNEVYRNWIVPQPALMGFRGHVDIEFTVERDGSLTNLRMLKSAGTAALDRAAMNALLGSRLLPLPTDYGPPRVTMNVTFYYNEGPRES
jgi:TonB family protein